MEESNSKYLKIIVLGNPATWKTSIIKKFLNNGFSDRFEKRR